MAEPELIPGAVQVFDEVTPVLGAAADPIDEEDGDALRIIGLREVDSGGIAMQEIQRTPESAAAGVRGEPFIIEGGNVSKREIRGSAEFLVLLGNMYDSARRKIVGPA